MALDPTQQQFLIAQAQAEQLMKQQTPSALPTLVLETEKEEPNDLESIRRRKEEYSGAVEYLTSEEGQQAQAQAGMYGFDISSIPSDVSSTKGKINTLERAEDVLTHPDRYIIPEGYAKGILAETSPYVKEGKVDVLGAYRAGEFDVVKPIVSEGALSSVQRYVDQRSAQGAVRKALRGYASPEEAYKAGAVTPRQLETLYGAEGASLIQANAATLASRTAAQAAIKKKIPAYSPGGELSLTAAGLAGISASTLRAAGYEVPSDYKAGGIHKGLVTSVSAKPDTSVQSYESWLKERGMTPAIQASMNKSEMAELMSSYEMQYGLGKWNTPLNRFTKWGIEKPYMAIASPLLAAGAVTMPLWIPALPAVGAGILKAAPIVTGKLVATGFAATGVTGGSLTAAGAFIPRQEGQPGGIYGAYKRGVETYWNPAMEATRKALPGIPGELVTGGIGYFAPHETFTRLTETKGLLAATVLIPHFGPTIAATALQWRELKPWQQALGIGAGIAPYAVGPIGSAFSRLSRVPYVGTGLRTITAPVRTVGGFVGEALSPLKLNQWAPWRGAYTLSEGVGRAGLGRVPVIGPAGYQWGWWGKAATPLSMRPQPRVATPKEVAADLAREQATSLRRGYDTMEYRGVRYEYDAGTDRWSPSRFTPEEAQELYQHARTREAMAPAREASTQPSGIYTWETEAPSISVQALTNVNPIQRVVMATTAPVMATAPLAPLVVSPFIAPQLGFAFAPVTVRQIATDLSTMQSMVNQGVITPEQRNIISNTLVEAQQAGVTQNQYNQIKTEVQQSVLDVSQIAYAESNLPDIMPADILSQIQQTQMTKYDFQQLTQPYTYPFRYDETVINRPVVEESPEESPEGGPGTPVPPPFPPIIGWPGNLLGGGRGLRIGLAKGDIGVWQVTGYDVYAPDPLTGEVVGGRVGKRSVRYGSTPKRDRAPRFIRGAMRV